MCHEPTDQKTFPIRQPHALLQCGSRLLLQSFLLFCCLSFGLPGCTYEWFFFSLDLARVRSLREEVSLTVAWSAETPTMLGSIEVAFCLEAEVDREFELAFGEGDRLASAVPKHETMQGRFRYRLGPMEGSEAIEPEEAETEELGPEEREVLEWCLGARLLEGTRRVGEIWTTDVPFGLIASMVKGQEGGGISLAELVPERGGEDVSGLRISCILDKVEGDIAHVRYWAIYQEVKFDPEADEEGIDMELLSAHLNVAGRLEYDGEERMIRENELRLVLAMEATVRGAGQRIDVAVLGRAVRRIEPKT